MTIVLFIVGLGLLVLGAEALVRGASRMAGALGISPLIVGLTVVAFGTSSPELAVSVKAAVAGQADIAIGNVVGSNIFNVLFILGLSAIIVPLIVAQQLIKLDVPLMIGASVLLWVLAQDGTLSFLDGAVLFFGLSAYIALLIRQSRKETAAIKAEYDEAFAPPNEPVNWLSNLALVLGGLAMLVLGSRWLVESAVTFAQHMGVSELVIGLTIVAAGTSLPEVVTSLIAAIRGERDIAVGNVVGSNLFNLMGVLGLASMVAPAGLPVSASAIAFDIPIMIAVAVACLPIFFTGGIISRGEGALFLGYYVAYTLYLIMAANQHAQLSLLRDGLLYFALPLTAITLLIITTQSLRKHASLSSGS
jgi:cation:H+ antiporter